MLLVERLRRYGKLLLLDSTHDLYTLCFVVNCGVTWFTKQLGGRGVGWGEGCGSATVSQRGVGA